MVEYFQNRVTDPFILEVRRESFSQGSGSGYMSRNWKCLWISMAMGLLTM